MIEVLFISFFIATVYSPCQKSNPKPWPVLSLRYKAVYNYNPQNRDELELREGDIVQVMEKCDDGWFVGKEFSQTLHSEDK